MWRTEQSGQRVERLPNGFLDTVIGYEDIKELFKSSVQSRKQTHILLAGPPASAKTVLLLECKRLSRSYYLTGSKATKAGLVEALFNKAPAYLLIDELDKLDKEARLVLLGLMDPGIVTDVKFPTSRVARFKSNVYAAVNEFDSLMPELLSRFHFKLQLKAYTYEEFIEVGVRVLTMLEGVSRSLAEYIVEKVAQYSRDVRDSIGVARLAQKKEQVDQLIETQLRYFPYSRKLYRWKEDE